MFVYFREDNTIFIEGVRICISGHNIFLQDTLKKYGYFLATTIKCRTSTVKLKIKHLYPANMVEG